MELKFSTTGIRGISNKTMTAELALKLGRTLGTFLDRKGRVLIARDTRTSSEMLRSALVSGLLSAGVDVVDAGVAPVPALSHCVMTGFDAGVMITSSHNPPEYNGVKFITGGGVEFSTEEEKKFLEMFKNEPVRVAWDKVGALEERNILGDYEKKLFELADTALIRTKNYKVVVDTVNGAQGVLMPALLEKLGCDVVGLFTELKGVFERTPEPRPETLDVLKRKVAEERADFGVAFDVDGDRCIFVDEKGEVVMGDVTGTLLARELIREKKGARIVTPISTSKVMDDVAEKEGGEILKTKVGAKYIGETLKKEDADYGFEETGGSFFPEISYTRDGSAATVKVLEALAKSGKKFSELVAELPKYYQIKLKVPYAEDKKADISKLSDKIDRENKEIITMDGIKAVFEDGSALMRASGTEPLIRIFVEATSLEKAEEYAAWGKGLVNTL